MAVRTTREADEDIASLYAYGLERYGRVAAEKYLAELLDAFDNLAANPYLARVRLVQDHRSIRLLPVGAYHVFYAVDDEDVVVVRVLYGTSSWIDHL